MKTSLIEINSNQCSLLFLRISMLQKPMYIAFFAIIASVFFTSCSEDSDTAEAAQSAVQKKLIEVIDTLGLPTKGDGNVTELTYWSGLEELKTHLVFDKRLSNNDSTLFHGYKTNIVTNDTINVNVSLKIIEDKLVSNLYVMSEITGKYVFDRSTMYLIGEDYVMFRYTTSDNVVSSYVFNKNSSTSLVTMLTPEIPVWISNIEVLRN